MRETLRTLNEMERTGVLRSYAIGGAMALLFHAEPVLTYDLDVFCFLAESDTPLVSLAPIYEHLRALGCEVEAEHVLIAGVQVQFIPAYNALVTEAVEQAQSLVFEGERLRVCRLGHLLAIMAQTGRAKDRERIAVTLQSARPDAALLTRILEQHHLTDPWQKIISKA